MGLIISVVRCADMPDCSLNGISAQFSTLTLVNAEGPFKPTPERPAVAFQRHPTMKNVVYIVPVDYDYTNDTWTYSKRVGMMGGNFGYTSDSRFFEAAEKFCGYRWHGAIKIHDRFE